jgi:hypothetical protein
VWATQAYDFNEEMVLLKKVKNETMEIPVITMAEAQLDQSKLDGVALEAFDLRYEEMALLLKVKHEMTATKLMEMAEVLVVRLLKQVILDLSLVELVH